MPKMKSNRGAMKRFRLTGRNKIKRKKAFARHILTTKSSKRKRKLRKSTLVHKSEERRVREMIVT